MSDEPNEEDGVETVRAHAHRELLREANRQAWTADRVARLVEFFDTTYPDLNVIFHPSFPAGVLVAYTTAEE